MNAPPAGTSRFAELTQELMGAKFASDFVREVWANASPEVKAELADSIVVALKAEIASQGQRMFGFNNIFERICIEIAEANATDIRAALEPAVLAMIEPSIAKVKREIDSLLERNFTKKAWEAIGDIATDRRHR